MPPDERLPGYYPRPIISTGHWHLACLTKLELFPRDSTIDKSYKVVEKKQKSPLP